jgi:hypothetical protein
MQKIDINNPLRKSYDYRPTAHQVHFKNQWCKVFGLSPRSFYKHLNAFEAGTVALFEYVFDTEIKSTEFLASKFDFTAKADKLKWSQEEVNAKIDEFLNAPFHS